MISVPSHIDGLIAYNPGKTVAEYQQEFGFTQKAVLWNNENNLGVPQCAKEAITKVLDEMSFYPDPMSFELKKALATWVGVEVNQINVENGSESILANIFKGFVGQGENIVTSQGSFVSVYVWAKSFNIETKLAPLNADYGFDLDAMLGLIDDQTKVVYICNPNNPTGTMISDEELQTFMQKVPKHILVVVDEAYYEYAKEIRTDYPNSVFYKDERIITLRTFSKAFGLAGARLGYAIAHPKMIEVLNKVKMTFAPSNITQAAGLGALNDLGFLEKTIQLNTDGMAFMKSELDKLGVYYADTAANFLMLDLKTEENAFKITQTLLKQGVFVRCLKAFGLSHCIRVSVGLPEENEYFIRRFSEVLAEN